MESASTELAQRCLRKELNRWDENGPMDTMVEATDDDPFNWTITINGPSGTPYEGGVFLLNARFPDNYPYSPPDLRFITPIFHGQVASDHMHFGHLDRWDQSRRVVDIVQDILMCMESPDRERCTCGAAAEMFIRSPDDYKKTAKEWTQQHAVA